MHDFMNSQSPYVHERGRTKPRGNCFGGSPLLGDALLSGSIAAIRLGCVGML